MSLAPVSKAAVTFTLLESELRVDFAIAPIADFGGFDNTSRPSSTIQRSPGREVFGSACVPHVAVFIHLNTRSSSSSASSGRHQMQESGDVDSDRYEFTGLAPIDLTITSDNYLSELSVEQVTVHV
jgi:hypothetical protein